MKNLPVFHIILCYCLFTDKTLVDNNELSVRPKTEAKNILHEAIVPE